VTVGAWEAAADPQHRFEFFILSPTETAAHVETLAMIANFHADRRFTLHVGSTVDIGRPWIEGASADHLMVSLPYPYGPDLEWCETPSGKVQVLWLVPITGAEAGLARTKGTAALEQLLEDSDVNVIAADRKSLV
jgi:hypothetical protein